MKIIFATPDVAHFATRMSEIIDESARVKGVALARRSPEYLRAKIVEGKAVIAIEDDDILGFCYIESWEGERYVATSGLVVVPSARGRGLGKQLKAKAFELARVKFPHSKIFGLTTNPAVVSINADLGYKPVAFSKLTEDEQFWKGCEGCSYFDILERLERTNCLCTGMLFDPTWKDREA